MQQTYLLLSLVVVCHLECKTVHSNCCCWGWDRKDIKEEEKKVR